MRHILVLMLAVMLLCGAAAAAPTQAVPRTGAKAAPAAKFAVPFVENDYAKVLADAQKRNVPIFVDTWAPW